MYISLQNKKGKNNAVGNRSFFSKEKKQENTGQNVLQKMAVMAIDNYDAQDDALVWNNMDWAVKKATGPIGDLSDHKVWDKLTNREEIRIVEHGELKKVGDKSAADIAASMFTGLIKIPTGISIGRITFQSCYAGKDDSGSLVSEMKGELTTQGISNVPVVGRTGVAFGFEGMGEATAETSTTKTYSFSDTTAESEYTSIITALGTSASEYGIKAYCEAMYELRNERTKVSNVKIFNTPFQLFGYKEPWDLVGKTKSAWYSLSAQDRSIAVSAEMEDYWSKLKTKMEAKTAFKPSKEAINLDVDRITEEFVQSLIDNNENEMLEFIFKSSDYPLSKWDQDAWNIFLDWLTGQV